MAEPINLQPFCGINHFNPWMEHPFSRGEYTYATNGHIAIRVARREDVPEHPKSPDIERLFTDVSGVQWRQLRKVELPDVPSTKCRDCDGRGTVHDCPDCKCDCDECDGTGEIESDASACIGDALFNTKYIRLLAALPWIEVPITDLMPEPMPFRFEGGTGLLMSLRRQFVNHIDISA